MANGESKAWAAAKLAFWVAVVLGVLWVSATTDRWRHDRYNRSLEERIEALEERIDAP